MSKSALSRGDTTYGGALRQSDANCNSHANTHCYCYRDSYRHINTHSYSYSPTHANAKI